MTAGIRESGFGIRDATPATTVARARAVQSRIPDLQSRSARGFTLIELVAAFVIFALAFGILLQILGGALHTTAQSAEYTRAALWAQSLLDNQGIGAPLQEGSSSGRFDDHYSWDLNIARYDPPPVTTTVAPITTANAGGSITTPVTPLDLFQLELVVNWGNQFLQHHARFSTVRVMNPPLQAGNTIPPPPPIRARQ
jgi:general secretion pathway protein I